MTHCLRLFHLRQFRTPFGGYLRERTPITELGDGERRAALLIAYGTLDWFYPYFEVVGRDIDQALLDEWLEARHLV